MMKAHEKRGYLFEIRNKGGVAICLPVNQILPMLKYFDTLKIRHDDERISQFLMNRNFKVCFPIPSLIDHDDHNASLAGNAPRGRQAYKFIDRL